MSPNHPDEDSEHNLEHPPIISLPGIGTGSLISYVATDKERLSKTKAVLFKELEKAKSGVIKDEEVHLAKAALTDRQKISLQAYRSLAYQMALDEIYGLGYEISP